MKTAKAVKLVDGVSLNARNGQQVEAGCFAVRELTARERNKLPLDVARLEGPSIAGVSRVYLSVENATTNGGYYVLAIT